jgi:hypothetical protein
MGMVIYAICALVKNTDIKTHGFQIPQRQYIATMSEDGTIECRMAF